MTSPRKPSREIALEAKHSLDQRDESEIGWSRAFRRGQQRTNAEHAHGLEMALPIEKRNRPKQQRCKKECRIEQAVATNKLCGNAKRDLNSRRDRGRWPSASISTTTLIDGRAARR